MGENLQSLNFLHNNGVHPHTFFNDILLKVYQQNEIFGGQSTLLSFIMRPHAKNFYNFLFGKDLIDEAMLDIYSPRYCTL